MARFAVPNSGNQVVIASRDATDLDQALLLMRAAEFDRTSRFDFAFEDLVRGRIE
jgi:hypothetical protein